MFSFRFTVCPFVLPADDASNCHTTTFEANNLNGKFPRGHFA